jgi:hypothetical protein
MGGKSPKQTIEDLKKQLKAEQYKNEVWKMAMEIVEAEYGVDVKKKYLTPYQREMMKKMEKRSPEK